MSATTESFDLYSALKKWQKKLRLQDWDITVEWVDDEELDTDLGEVNVFMEKRMAKIKISRLNPEREYGWSGWDPERTLVHELVHIHLHPFSPRNHHGEIFVEQAVHALSVALLEERRDTDNA